LTGSLILWIWTLRVWGVWWSKKTILTLLFAQNTPWGIKLNFKNLLPSIKSSNRAQKRGPLSWVRFRHLYKLWLILLLWSEVVVFNLQWLGFPKQCLNCTSNLYLLFTVQMKFENKKCHFLPRVW
jgi:hypothetical protein